MSRHWVLVTALSIAFLAPPPIGAQVVEVPTFLVATGSSAHNLQDVDVAVGTDNTIVYLWGDYDTTGVTSSNRAMTQRYAGNGVALASPVRIDIAGRLLRPVISSSPIGGFVATWVQSEVDGGHALIGRRLNTAGGGIGGELKVDIDYGPVTAGRVAGLPSGSVFFWIQNGLWGHLYDNAGQSRGAAFNVGSNIPAFELDVAALADGGFVTVWPNLWDNGSWARIYDADGQPRDVAVRIGEQFFARHVAVSPQGAIAVVGIKAPADPAAPGQLLVQRLGADAAPVGGQIVVADGVPDDYFDTDLDFASDGRLYVVWGESSSDQVFPPRARLFDQSGNPLGDAVPITTVPSRGLHTARLYDQCFANIWFASSAAWANIVCAPGGSANPTATPGETATPTPTATAAPPAPTATPKVVPARCGDGVVDSDEECDDGNTISGDGCDARCLIETCGNGRIEGNEACDDGNTVDGDGCQANCTRTPKHDCVMVMEKPIDIVIPAGQPDTTKEVALQVRNADKGEHPGDVIQITSSEGTCPAGTIDEAPDFDRGKPGTQDSTAVNGGATQTALTVVKAARASFPALDPKVPQRCTLVFACVTLVDGNVDPTPENNTITVEVNVVAAGSNGNQSAQLPAAVLPEFFIGSAKPVNLKLPRRGGQSAKRLPIKVGVADGGTTDPSRAVTVTTSDGDCPPGTLGVVDFSGSAAGAPNTVPIPPGQTRRGGLVAAVDSGAFAPSSQKSPARCTAALISTSSDGDSTAASHTTAVPLEVRP